MNAKEILRHVDHTLLTQTATWEEIRAVVEDGIRYDCASVCIPASYVERAAEYAGGKVAICTVIGFPNGYDTTAVKCCAAEDAVRNGASEIDMVVNLGRVRDGRYDFVLAEINEVKAACHGRILKVIIETCLLTEEEKLRLCEVVSASDADYIKTSTGFAGGGATEADVAFLAAHMTNGKKIKAAGGIGGLADAEKFLLLGADRIGTSRVVKAVKAAEREQTPCE